MKNGVKVMALSHILSTIKTHLIQIKTHKYKMLLEMDIVYHSILDNGTRWEKTESYC